MHPPPHNVIMSAGGHVRGNQLVFHVKDGIIHVTALRQYEHRGWHSVAMLSEMVESAPELFEGKAGTIFYEDVPPPAAFANKDLNFCSTVSLVQPGPWLPFPCFAFVDWRECGVPDGDELVAQLLADNRPPKSHKLFWIGSNTHPTRRRLADLGKANPGVIDATIMEWNRSTPGALKSKGRHVSIPDHANFKYLADCQGWGYSARLKWLLATGRPVFIVARNSVEHWHRDLVPWIHYVPVNNTLSDLLENHTRLENDPSLYWSISRSARAFAAENLNRAAQVAACVEAPSARLTSTASSASIPAYTALS